MIRNKREPRGKSKENSKVQSKEQKLTMFFQKTGHEMKEANRALIPEKQRNMIKIKQGSPMKTRSNIDSQKQDLSSQLQGQMQNHQENSLEMYSQPDYAVIHKAMETSQKDDAIDMQIQDDDKQFQDELASDPTQLNRRTRGVKRNYKQMIDGDEVFQRTIEDEQREIIEKKLTPSQQTEFESRFYSNQSPKRGRPPKNSDKIFNQENDLKVDTIMVTKGLKTEDAVKAAAQDESESDFEEQIDNMEEEDLNFEPETKKGATNKRSALDKTDDMELENLNPNNEADDTVFIDNLPKDADSLRSMIKEVNKHIRDLERQFFEEEDSEIENDLKNNLKKEDASVKEYNQQLQMLKEKSHIQQFWTIPMSDNVVELQYKKLAEAQKNKGGRLFDVITCDPPWQLSSANPTRGVAIAYETLNDKQILDIPFHELQTDGFLFIWVINAKYRFALSIMEHFGYKLVDEIAWVKQTVNGKIAKGHGYYLQHAKETCLIGVKGNVNDRARFNIETDVIFSQRRGQSQKPEEIYDIAEAMMPNGYYLEIFGRRNNLHNGWVTIGNEL